MKYTTYALLTALALLIQGCATSTTETAPENGRVTAYTVYGMDCPGCHGGLEKNLEKIPGVEDASANWKKQTVRIRIADSADVSPEQVRQAVEDSNFTLGESGL